MPIQNLPLVDLRRCTVCGDCLECCPVDCLTMNEGERVVVAPQECVGCGVCEAVCPETAIAMQLQDW